MLKDNRVNTPAEWKDERGRKIGKMSEKIANILAQIAVYKMFSSISSALFETRNVHIGS